MTTSRSPEDVLADYLDSLDPLSGIHARQVTRRELAQALRSTLADNSRWEDAYIKEADLRMKMQVERDELEAERDKYKYSLDACVDLARKRGEELVELDELKARCEKYEEALRALASMAGWGTAERERARRALEGTDG